MTLIVLVEHSDVTRTHLKRGLEAAGLEVVATQGGAETLRLLVDTPADLAIVDLDVSDLGGPQLIRAIRFTYDLAVLALSESHDASGGTRASLAGADRTIRKLGDPARLVHEVISWVYRHDHPDRWVQARPFAPPMATASTAGGGILLQWPGSG